MKSNNKPTKNKWKSISEKGIFLNFYATYKRLKFDIDKAYTSKDKYALIKIIEDTRLVLKSTYSYSLSLSVLLAVAITVAHISQDISLYTSVCIISIIFVFDLVGTIVSDKFIYSYAKEQYSKM